MHYIPYASYAQTHYLTLHDITVHYMTSRTCMHAFMHAYIHTYIPACTHPSINTRKTKRFQFHTLHDKNIIETHAIGATDVSLLALSGLVMCVVLVVADSPDLKRFIMIRS